MNDSMLTPNEARRLGAKLSGITITARVNDAGEWLVEALGSLILPGGRGKHTTVTTMRGLNVLSAVDVAIRKLREAYELPVSTPEPSAPKAG